MACINVIQHAFGRFILGIEKRRENVFRRGFIDQLVDVTNERRKFQMRMQGLEFKRGLETGHNQSATNSFSWDAANGNPPPTPLQRKQVVKVPADASGRLVEGFA